MEEIPVLVLNSSDAPKKVAANTILADLSAAECVDEQDHQEEGKEGQDKFAHLAGLMDGVEDSMTERQREHLTQVLEKYADVFSTGELDLGRHLWPNTGSTLGTPD